MAIHGSSIPRSIHHQGDCVFAWLRRLSVKKQALPPVSSYYQEELDHLNASSIDYTVYSDVTTLETVFGNIVEYCHWLDRLDYGLHGDLVFPIVIFKVRLVRKCHFWLDEKGEPIDVHQYHQRFVEKAIKILKRHELLRLENSDPKIAASLYRSQALLYNLCIIVKQL